MKVLVVDDNADDRKLIRLTLERHGCETVIEARDGQEGLDLAGTHKPDLIISDALMPGMDGFQLLKLIKADATLKTIPFVFHSAVYTGLKDRELALFLGADAFITKPVTPDALWQELAANIGINRTVKATPPTEELLEEEKEYLRKYSGVVAAKLEEKVRELEETLERRKKAEEALRSSEIRYRRLFEASKDGILILSLNSGKVIDVNPFMIDLLGYPRDEYFEKKLSETGPFKNSDACRTLLNDMQSIDYIHIPDISLQTGKDRPIDVELICCSYAIDDDTLIQCNIRDITERKQLLDLSYHDGLTGVPNRRHFDQQLQMEWKRCARHGSPLALLMADIDYFKAYNDSYGHLHGDECLKQVAICLAGKARRAGDLVARYGGEEFVVLLPETDIEGACIVAGNMRSAVEALNLAHAGSLAADCVTISLGVATVTLFQQGNPHDLISAADRALYAAKSAGRNCIAGDNYSAAATPAVAALQVPGE